MLLLKYIRYTQRRACRPIPPCWDKLPDWARRKKAALTSGQAVQAPRFTCAERVAIAWAEQVARKSVKRDDTVYLRGLNSITTTRPWLK